MTEMTEKAPTECAHDTSPSLDGGCSESSAEGTRDLIVWSLSLSPEERLAVLQDFVDSFWTETHG